MDVLVNGNTRAVALRQRYIRLIVLPEDAGRQEIDRLELQLQMQLKFKQDYTFTNRLPAVNDMIGRYHQSYEEIAQALGWSVAGGQVALRSVAAAQAAGILLRFLQLVDMVDQCHRSRPTSPTTGTGSCGSCSTTSPSPVSAPPGRASWPRREWLPT
ncbi:MAG TPA: hypothetical protein VFA45_25830 [Actinomycetes bacterium]|jgi:hypothetical protein|nr:hypothetical protein [Actinomycetes bacterium]